MQLQRRHRSADGRRHPQTHRGHPSRRSGPGHRPETGEHGPRTVAAVLVHEDILLDLIVEGGATVTTTEDHPFWNVTDRKWQQAQEISNGDQLLAADGGTVVVGGLNWSSVRAAGAYNLSVGDIHTYYVAIGHSFVLVHNDDLCKLPVIEGSGKVHGDLPSHVPDNWTRDDLEQLADDLRVSIATRKRMNDQLGLDYRHALRLTEEGQLLRQVEKKLSGS